MRKISPCLAGILMMSLSLATPAMAQDRHAVAPSDLARTVAQHSASQDADRAIVRDALSRAEVRSVATAAGVDIDRLSASVDTLSPDALARAADAARNVDSALVGGASTITISTTTIVIVLLIIILILVAD